MAVTHGGLLMGARASERARVPHKPRLCAAVGCGDEALIGKDWCGRHYAAYYRAPDPERVDRRHGFTLRAAKAWRRITGRGER